MPDMVVLPVPRIGTLALTRAQFSAALAEGERVPLSTLVSAASSEAFPEELVDAEEMEKRTGVPASWWMAQARNRKIAFHQIGRRVRFNARAVLSEYAVKRRTTPAGE
jgi:hypothetical protein